LTGPVASVDVATKENLENLVKVGKSLLNKPVSRENLETGRVEPTNEGTNKQALVRLVCTIERVS
jgi:hypothetical protein